MRSKRARKITMRRLFREHLDDRALGFIDFGDHSVFVDPRDQTIAFELLLGRGWQRSEIEAVISYLARHELLKGDGFLDVGANIGTQTVYAMLTGQFQKAIAVEPAPSNLAILRRNIAVNRLCDRVRICAAAASEGAGSVQLRLNPTNAGGHSIERDMFQSDAGSIEVAAQSIDEIVIESGWKPDDIGLLWMDVEGHEMAALKGASTILSRGIPLCFEYGAASYGGGRRSELLNLLAAHYATAVDVADLVAQDETVESRPIAEWLDDQHRDLLLFNPAS